MAGIKVRRQAPVLVVPAKPTTNKSKELSDIDDQQLFRLQVPVILSFRANHLKRGEDPAKVIKYALAEALVYYYPFAGRLREGHNRKLIVDCNGKGVLFVEADAYVTLEEIQNEILPPCPLLEELLFDVPGSSGIVGCPLLLFQVTRFLCGGYILAIRFNHTMCDMFGLVQLLNAMIEIVRGAQAPSIVPLWERKILCASYPLKVTCTHHEYEEVHKTYEQATHKDKSNKKVHGGFFFGAKELQAIRNHLPFDLQQSSSTFELLCACIWRCQTLALQPNPEEIIRLSMAFNVRGRNIISLPLGYYGNTVVTPAIVTKAKDLICEKSLGYALMLVKQAKAKVNKEYLRSVTNLMVIKGRPDFKEFMNWLPSNTMRTGLEKVDFGWGTPLYCGVPRALSFMSNFTRFKNGKGDDVIAVVLCLPIEAMFRFQMELARMTGGKPFHRLLHLPQPALGWTNSSTLNSSL